MKKLIGLSVPIVVIVLSAVWAGVQLAGQRATRPIAGSFHRSKVDEAGHARGIVQVDLMRRFLADRARLAPSSITRERERSRRVPSQSHPLLGHFAPSFALEDAEGKTRRLDKEISGGPVVVVFSLGSTCVACATHLVELDVAISRFQQRNARVLAVSADTPEFSRARMRRFGSVQIPLLSDRDRAASRSFGVWKPVPGGDEDEGETLHGTFIIDHVGSIRWAYVGDRPFADVEALLAELDSL